MEKEEAGRLQLLIYPAASSSSSSSGCIQPLASLGRPKSSSQSGEGSSSSGSDESDLFATFYEQLQFSHRSSLVLCSIQFSPR